MGLDSELMNVPLTVYLCIAGAIMGSIATYIVKLQAKAERNGNKKLSTYFNWIDFCANFFISCCVAYIFAFAAFYFSVSIADPLIVLAASIGAVINKAAIDAINEIAPGALRALVNRILNNGK